MDRNSFARSLGSPPRADDIADVQRWMRAVHQILVAGEGFKGGVGSPNRYIKARDLTESGVKALARYGFGYSGGTVETIISSGGAGLPPYTAPIAPTNLAVISGVRSIFLEWEYPPEYSIYLSHFEIWRAESDDLGAAILIKQASSTITDDTVGSGSPTYYYWVRAVSVKNDYSPFNATNGEPGQTALDPAYVVELLNGQISATELNSNLNTTLEGIGVNSVAIANESTTRATETGELYGNWSIKAGVELADGRTYVSGFGTSLEVINGVPVSNIIMKATNFAIGFPGSNDFTLTSGPVNGIPTIGISSANIIDLAVKNAAIDTVAAEKLFTAEANMVEALIGNGEITNAKIGNEIQSNSYIPGAVGWRIDKSGFIECRNLTAVGNITASSLDAFTANIVDTIHVRGQAITFPTWAANYAPVPFNIHTNTLTVTETGWTPCASIGIVSQQAAPVSISMNSNLTYLQQLLSPFDLGSGVVKGTFILESRLVKDGVQVLPPRINARWYYSDNAEGDVIFDFLDVPSDIIYNFIDVSPAGTNHQFQIQVRLREISGQAFLISTTNPITFERRYESSVAIELKK